MMCNYTIVLTPCVPQGPQKGSRHVSRIFARSKKDGFSDKFDRTGSLKTKHMRIVIKAKYVKDM